MWRLRVGARVAAVATRKRCVFHTTFVRLRVCVRAQNDSTHAESRLVAPQEMAADPVWMRPLSTRHRAVLPSPLARPYEYDGPNRLVSHNCMLDEFE